MPPLQPITLKDDDSEDIPVSLPERDPTMPHLAPIHDTVAYKQVLVDSNYYCYRENIGINSSFG